MARFNPFAKAKKGDNTNEGEDAGAVPEVKLHKRVRRAADGCDLQAAKDALSGLRKGDKQERLTVKKADFVVALQKLLPKLGEAHVEEVTNAFASEDGKRVLYADAFRQLFGSEVLGSAGAAAGPLDKLGEEAQAELRHVARSAVPALRSALEGHDVGTRGEIRAQRFIEEVQAAVKRRIRSEDAEALASAFPGSRTKSTDYNAFLTELERWANSPTGGQAVDWDVLAAVADKLKQEVERLSEERGESAVEDVFAAMDDDDSGTLSSRELKQALKKLGVKVASHERRALIDALDTNGNGQLDLDEFVDLCLEGAKVVRKRAAKLEGSSAAPNSRGVDWRVLRKVAAKLNVVVTGDGPSEGAVETAFDKMDKNGDGRVSAEELDGGLAALDISLSGKERACLIKALDSDGDGQLDLAEFEDLCLEGESAVKKLQSVMDVPPAPSVQKGAAHVGDGSGSGEESAATPGAGAPPTSLPEKDQEAWVTALEKAAAEWKAALAPRSGEARGPTPAFGILEDTARARPGGFSLRRVCAALLTAGGEPGDALAKDIAPVLALARPRLDRGTGPVHRDAAPEQVRVLGEPLLKLARGGASTVKDLLKAHPAHEWARDVDGVSRCLAAGLRAGWGAAPGEHAPGERMLAALRRANALAPAIASWDAFYAVLAASAHARSGGRKGRKDRKARGSSQVWDPLVTEDSAVEALRGAGVGAAAHAAGRELVRECSRAGGRARLSALRRTVGNALLEDEPTFGPDPWRDVAESLCMGEVGEAAEGAVTEQDCAALLREAHALALSGGPACAEAVAAGLGVEGGDDEGGKGTRDKRSRGKRDKRSRGKRSTAPWGDAAAQVERFLPGLAPVAARSLLENLSRGKGGNVDAAGLVRVLEAVSGAAVEYPRAAASGAAHVDAASAARFRSDLVTYLQRGRGARSALVAAAKDLDFTDSGFLALEEMAAALRSVGVSATRALVASLAGRGDAMMTGSTVQYAPFIRHWSLEALEAVEARLAGREPHARETYMDGGVAGAEWSAGSYRPPRGSLGEWLYTSASDVERRNFAQLLQQLQRFEESTGLAQSRRARGDERFYGASVGDDTVVLQLGTKLRCEMRFHVGM